MKVMAIDYGDARTGVAISDATGLLAGFTTVIHGHKAAAVAQEAARLACLSGKPVEFQRIRREIDPNDPQDSRHRAYDGIPKRVMRPVKLFVKQGDAQRQDDDTHHF